MKKRILCGSAAIVLTGLTGAMFTASATQSCSPVIAADSPAPIVIASAAPAAVTLPGNDASIATVTVVASRL